MFQWSCNLIISLKSVLRSLLSTLIFALFVAVTGNAQNRPAPLAYAEGDFIPIESDLGEVYKLGKGTNTLLLIPCASCRWRSFDQFMVRNAERYTMYAVTLPGYGGTTPPQLPMWTGVTLWQNHALAALELLLEQEKLTDVTAVGSSFGSTMALQLAASRPDIITGLVNLDGSLTTSLETEKRTPNERLKNARKIMLQWGFPYTSPDRWQNWNNAAIVASPERRMLYHGWFMATDPEVMMQYWRENLLESRNDEFRGLSMPVLDVQAIRPWDDTPEATRVNTLKQLEEVGTPDDYQLIFLYDTPHFIMEERPKLLDRIISDFLAGRPLTDFKPENEP